MQTTWLKALIVPSVLLLCSCSTDTAEVPEMDSAAVQAIKLPEDNVEPAKVLSKQQDLFGNAEQKGAEFAGDPLLQAQGSLNDFNTGSILPNKQEDFSQEIDLDVR